MTCSVHVHHNVGQRKSTFTVLRQGRLSPSGNHFFALAGEDVIADSIDPKAPTYDHVTGPALRNLLCAAPRRAWRRTEMVP